VTDTSDLCGPYRTTIEDNLDTCADYLSRLPAASLDTIRRRTTLLGRQIHAVDLAHTTALRRAGTRVRCVPPPADPPLSAGL
jgi:hypothetical protein